MHQVGRSRHLVALVVVLAVLAGLVTLADVGRAPEARAAGGPLPLASVRNMAVDPGTGRVFITGDDAVVVAAHDGTTLQVIPNVYGAAGIDVAGGFVYVGESTAGKIAKIDPVAMTVVQTYTVGTTIGTNLAIVGTGAFFGVDYVGLKRFDLVTSSLELVTVVSRPEPRRIPGSTTQLLVYDGGNETISRIVATAPFSLVASWTRSDSSATTFATNADASRVVVNQSYSAASNGLFELGPSLAPDGVRYVSTVRTEAPTWSPGHGGLFAAVQDGWSASAAVVVWQAGTMLPVASVPVDTMGPSLLRLSTDGDRAYVLVGPRLIVASLRPSAAVATPNPVVRDVPTIVTVTGAGLAGTTGVTVAGVAAPIQQVAPGAVSFTVPAGIPTGTQTVTLSSFYGPTSVLLTVQPNAGATLSGTVRRGTTPVAGATLTLSGGGLSPAHTTLSAADGTYAFTGLGAASDYALGVHDPAGGPDQTRRPIALTPNLATTVDLDVSQPLPGGVDLARTPIGNAGLARDILVHQGTGRVFVSAGDDVVVTSATGALLGRLRGIVSAGNLAQLGNDVFVGSDVLAQIFRIDPTTLAVTGTWSTGTGSTGDPSRPSLLAAAAGRVWSPHTSPVYNVTVLQGLDPGTGSFTDVGEPFSPWDMRSVPGRPNQLVTVDSGGLGTRVIDLSTSPFTVVAATVNNQYPAPRSPLGAWGSTDRLFDTMGKEFSLTTLQATGVTYGTTTSSDRPAATNGHGGAVVFGAEVFPAEVPVASHRFGDADLSTFDGPGDRLYRVFNGDLFVETLGPVINGLGTPVVSARPVTLTGSGLGATSAVRIDGNPVAFAVTDAATLTITGPAAGLHTVVVTTPWGDSSPVPLTVAASSPPTPPLDPRADTSGDGSVGHVSWSPPANDGGLPITGYSVTASPGGATCSTTGATSCDITVGASGYYTFTVVATNAAGSSAPSVATWALWLVPPPTPVPQPPWGVTAVAAIGSATVSWKAPTSGPFPTSYQVTAYLDGFTPLAPPVSTSSIPVVYTGLTPGRSYTFRVVARSGPDSSLPSADSPMVTIPTGQSAPTPPQNVRGTGSGIDSSIQVQWDPPSNDGGAPVTGYTATALPGNHSCSAPGWAGLCNISGLTNGTPYTITVTAANAIGTSPPSAPSAPVTPVIAGGASYFPLPPGRILDSRPSSQVGPYGTPWTTGSTRDVPVVGGAGVPADATAVALNVTVTGTSNPGFLTIWPTQTAQPVASSINWAAGQTVASAATVSIGPDGHIRVFAAGGPVDVIFDVVGYYRPAAGAGDGLMTLAPHRLFDSRASTQLGPYGTPWGPGTSRPVTVAGLGGVPADADAVVLNVTVTSTTAPSFLTLSPTGQARPLSSSLNWSAGQTIPNAVVAKVGAGGQIDVFNNAGNADVILDVSGYFTVGGGALFHPVSPQRTLDSRPASKVGPYDTPWGPQTARSLRVVSDTQVPVSTWAVAVQQTMTVTNATAASYLTVFPGDQAQPLVSSLNWTAGRTVANQVITPIGTTGDLWIANRAGTADVIADVNGWFG